MVRKILTASTRLCNRVHFIKEQNTWTGSASLVEQLTDVSLRSTEPHVQQLWSLDGNKVGPALVGDSLGHQRFSASRGPIEEDSARSLHSEALKQPTMFDWIPHHLLKLTLGLLQTSDILPFDIWNLKESHIMSLTLSKYIAIKNPPLNSPPLCYRASY